MNQITFSNFCSYLAHTVPINLGYGGSVFGAFRQEGSTFKFNFFQCFFLFFVLFISDSIISLRALTLVVMSRFDN